MKFLLTTAAFLICSLLFGQKAQNFVLEINGDTVSISVDEPVTFKAKNGQVYKVNLKQKELLSYKDEGVFFQYPAAFNISKKKVNEDLEQILCVSAGGNGFLIQKYKDVDPEDLVDLMIKEITQESKDAGYTETLTAVQKKLKSGIVLKGRESKLQLNDEINIFTAYPVKGKKEGGMLIVLLVIDPSDAKEMTALETFWKTLELQN